MSGSVSPLAQAMAGANTAIPQPTGGVPLSSLMAPNAADLQRGSPSVPWYNVPGMFPTAQQVPQAAAAPAAMSTPDLQTLLGILRGDPTFAKALDTAKGSMQDPNMPPGWSNGSG